MDLSQLDKKYFITYDIYNCPFCKRNNVKYFMVGYFRFDWTITKECFGYLIQCSSCQKTSLHFSFKDLRENKYSSRIGEANNYFNDTENIDNQLFFSKPSSFFILDNNIPENIRLLISESEESRQANHLIGASACLRKAIYELFKKEEIIVKNEKTGYADYQRSVKKLKEKFAFVDSTLFDALGNIQEMISNPLHEESWKEWDAKKLRFLIELFKTILEEMYVIPVQRKTRISELQKLKGDYENDKQPKKEIAT